MKIWDLTGHLFRNLLDGVKWLAVLFVLFIYFHYIFDTLKNVVVGIKVKFGM